MFKYLTEREYNAHKSSNSYGIHDIAKDDPFLIQRMSLHKQLDIHRGCVNTIVWDDKGEVILSGSDDQHLIISNPWTDKTVADIQTGHRANIFSAKFLPETGNQRIVSCSGDGTIFCIELDAIYDTVQNKFNCHEGTCYDVLSVPSCPNLFLSCGEDGTVRWFDLRVKSSCNRSSCEEDILLNMGQPVTAVALNMVQQHQIAVAAHDSIIRIYDRRMLGTRATDSYLREHNEALLMRLKPDKMDVKDRRITSMKYNSWGTEVLVSYSSENLYLFDITNSVDEQFKEIEDETPDTTDHDRGPTLKRLRLRGDWSDTGPQAVPESEMRYQAGEVGQARPALHTTLMQRMTGVLSRMLENRVNRRLSEDANSDTDMEQEAEPQNENSTEPQNETATEPQNETATEPQNETATEPQNETATESINETGTVPTNETEEQEEPMDLAVTSEETNNSETPERNEPASTQQAGENSSSTTNTLNTGISELTHELTQMRDNFRERYSVEPSVDIIYSGQGTSSASVRMSVGDEVTREYSPTNNQPTSSSTEEAAPSASAQEDSTPSGLSAQGESVEPPTPSTSSGTSHVKSKKRASSDIRRENRAATDSEPGPRNESSRMARVIQEVVHNVRKSRTRALDEPTDRPVPRGRQVQYYTGHRNARTMIKECNFWGDAHVMSGSDCGRIFVWNKYTGKLVMLWEADRHVVNCLQPHPTLPILASSGIDYDVKLWSACHPEPQYDEAQAKEIIRRNQALLEETRDTVTVPATFMIRMLASLNQIRQDRNRNRNQSTSEDSS